MAEEYEQTAINTLRTLAMDAVEEAQSGHMGLPLGAAPMAYTLWSKHLNITPLAPNWFNRDRFILSAGHGSVLLYSLLHLSGFSLSINDIKNFRKTGSKTPGHPEWGHTEGVDVTTGPLGQGLSMAVGMALAEKKLSSYFNRPDYSIIDHFTYVICGDGDLMEGVSHEALSFAGHLKLNKLIVLYDSNHSSLDAQLEQSYSDDIEQKFGSINWDYIKVKDGNDCEAINAAILKAKKSNKPSLIEVNTEIGYSLPNISGTHEAHSDPVGKENIVRAKDTLEWPYSDSFVVPQEAYDSFKELNSRGKKAKDGWEQLVTEYKKNYPMKGEILEQFIKCKIENKWESHLPNYSVENEPLATRTASHDILNIVAKHVPQLIGGAADLSSSTKVTLDDSKPITSNDFTGRNIYFGVREFGMAAIANGLALHNFIPYISTYFVFSDYMKPAMRLSAMMGLPVLYIFTHDSIAVGKDGPTHQPVEQLAALRSMPNMQVIRPADGNETAAAWSIALNETNKPTSLVLGRQKSETLPNTDKLAFEGVKRGGYILSESKEPQGILIATGSEVALAIKAQEELAKDNIEVNVVSLPSFEIFEKQSQKYKNKVLPSNLKKRLTIEMGAKNSWREYAGDNGAIMSINTFGESGDPGEVIKDYGFTVGNVIEQFKKLL